MTTTHHQKTNDAIERCAQFAKELLCKFTLENGENAGDVMADAIRALKE